MKPVPVLAGGRRWTAARLLLWGLGQALCAVALVGLARLAFDAPAGGGASNLAAAALGFGALAVAIPLLRVLERTDAERLGQDYAAAVRARLFRQVLDLHPRVLAGRRQGHLLLRFTSDLNALRLWVGQGLARLAPAVITLAGAMAALLWVDADLGLAVAAVLVSVQAALLACGPALTRRVREARRQRSRLAGNLGEKLRAAAVIRAFGQTARERRRVRRDSRRLAAAMVGRARLSGLARALPEAGVGLTLAALVLLSHDGPGGAAPSPGTLVAAMAVVGLLRRPLADLARLFDYRQGYRVAMERIETFLDLPVRPGGGERIARSGPGRLEFRGLSVAGSLEGIDALIEPGRVVAVVGPNGAGKSSLLAAAAGLLPPDAGAVLLDGRDLAGCDPGSVRRVMGLVGPGLPLLKGSIDRNIRYGRPRASAREVERVCRLCGLDELLERLPQGRTTRLAEGGGRLSGGFRARVALARALLPGPAVLLLDEVDAALDEGGRRRLDHLLAQRPATVLLVTHDPRRLARVDEIWHLRDGRLVERGPAREVLAGDGPTARLFGARSEPPRLAG